MPEITSAEKSKEACMMLEGRVAPCWPPATCPACGKRMAQSDSPFRGGQAPLELRQCAKCGMVCGRPAVDTYDVEEYEYYGALQGLPREQVLDPLTRSRYLQLLHDFARLTGGRKLLDVGCGRGGFVEAALSAGWDAMGIELSEPAVRLAQGLGLPVYLKDFFDPSIAPGWDVIVMTEVIEHLSRPGDFIARAEELLASGGMLYVTTPNWNSLERRYLGRQWDVIHREHLSYFSERSIRKVIVERSNLRILSVRTENVGLAKLWTIKRRDTCRKAPRKEASALARARDQKIRRRIYANSMLRACKWILNELLNCTELGSTLKVTCQKS